VSTARPSRRAAPSTTAAGPERPRRWEVRDKALAVLATSESGMHMASLLHNWSDDIVLLTDGPADFGAEDRARLSRAGIAVDERALSRLVACDGHLVAVAFTDSGERPRDGLLLPTRLRQRSTLAAQLGVAAAGPTAFADDPIEVDPMQRTAVPGVVAAGDLAADRGPNIVTAMATGALAAASVVHSLVVDQE
jgi:thioredoxin reductase